MTDPIADLLTRIRNAVMARKDRLTVPHSKLKMGILKVLKEKGFVANVETVKNGDFQEINIVLNDPRRGLEHFSTVHSLTLKKISKPGQRIYVKSSQLKKIHGGLG